MALRMVLWSDAWPEGATHWEFTSVEQHQLRQRGYVPIDEAPRAFEPPRSGLPRATFRFWRSEVERRGCWVADDPDAFRSTKGATGAYGGFCSNCSVALPALPEASYEYFERGSVLCRQCNVENDIWAMAIHTASEYEGRLLNLSNLGAFSTGFTIELSPTETRNVELLEYGIPAEAVILSLNFTAVGSGVQPLLIHGNEALRRFAGTTLLLYGQPFGDVRPDPINIQISVLWIYGRDNSEPWRLLGDAFEAVHQGRRSHVVVSAHSAFEVADLVRDYLRTILARKTVGEMELTAWTALNVFMPLLCSAANVTPPAKDILERLNTLRSRRNKVAHAALHDDGFTGSETAELLVAGVFGFEFTRFLRWKLIVAGKLPAPQSA